MPQEGNRLGASGCHGCQPGKSQEPASSSCNEIGNAAATPEPGDAPLPGTHSPHCSPYSGHRPGWHMPRDLRSCRYHPTAHKDPHSHCMKHSQIHHSISHTQLRAMPVSAIWQFQVESKPLQLLTYSTGTQDSATTQAVRGERELNTAVQRAHSWGDRHLRRWASWSGGHPEETGTPRRKAPGRDGHTGEMGTPGRWAPHSDGHMGEMGISKEMGISERWTP